MRASPRLINFLAVQTLVTVVFMVSLGVSCSECYFCGAAETGCNDVSGLSLDMATALGAGSRLFMAYIVMYFVCLATQGKPALDARYGHQTARLVLMIILGIVTAM